MIKAGLLVKSVCILFFCGWFDSITGLYHNVE